MCCLILSLAHVPVYLDGPKKVMANLMETSGAMFSNEMFRFSPMFSDTVPNENLARALVCTKSVVNKVSDHRLRKPSKRVPALRAMAISLNSMGRRPYSLSFGAFHGPNKGCW